MYIRVYIEQFANMSGVVCDSDLSLCLCISVRLSGVVPDGDMSVVCESEAVLSQQLADVPHAVSGKAT